MDSFGWISNEAPAFRVHGSRITIIKSPDEFFQSLKTLALQSSVRIVLSSLYLGSGKLDSELIGVLAESLDNQASTSGGPSIKFLLDYTRGTRGELNSCGMLQPLLRRRGADVEVSLFHNPLLRGLFKKLLPDRWNEVIGVQHMKLYIFDDNVLISGANLSDHYFVNRQDRYVLIRDKNLADFCVELVEVVSEHSFLLNKESGNLELHPLCAVHPYNGSLEGFQKSLREAVEDLIDRWRDRLGCSSGSELSLDPNSSLDSVVFPLIQMGSVEFNQDDCIMQKVLSMQDPALRLDLASGYFNLTDTYEGLLLDSCKASVRVLMASPQANGFWNGTGLSGAIPALYTHLARLFYDAIASRGAEERIQLHEYSRPCWTYHAKGMWWSHEESLETGPFATFVGSTNYGYRSVFRDLETQFLVVTQNRELQNDLLEEREALFSYSKRLDCQVFRRPDHYVPFWVRFVSRYIRSFF